MASGVLRTVTCEITRIISLFFYRQRKHRFLERTKTFLFVAMRLNVKCIIVYLKWYNDFINGSWFITTFFFLFVYDNLVEGHTPLEVPPNDSLFFSPISDSLFSLSHPPPFYNEIIIQKYDWWLQAIFFRRSHGRSVLLTIESMVSFMVVFLYQSSAILENLFNPCIQGLVSCFCTLEDVQYFEISMLETRLSVFRFLT